MTHMRTAFAFFKGISHINLAFAIAIFLNMASSAVNVLPNSFVLIARYAAVPEVRRIVQRKQLTLEKGKLEKLDY